VARY